MITIKIDFKDEEEKFFTLSRLQQEHDVREIKGNGKAHPIVAGRGKGIVKFRELRDKGVV